MSEQIDIAVDLGAVPPALPEIVRETNDSHRSSEWRGRKEDQGIRAQFWPLINIFRRTESIQCRKFLHSLAKFIQLVVSIAAMNGFCLVSRELHPQFRSHAFFANVLVKLWLYGWNV
jgi:hypothetical protein